MSRARARSVVIGDVSSRHHSGGAGAVRELSAPFGWTRQRLCFLTSSTTTDSVSIQKKVDS